MSWWLERGTAAHRACPGSWSAVGLGAECRRSAFEASSVRTLSGRQRCSDFWDVAVASLTAWKQFKALSILLAAKFERVFPFDDKFKVTMFDDLDILPNGDLVISEATTKYPYHQLAAEMMETTNNGRWAFEILIFYLLCLLSQQNAFAWVESLSKTETLETFNYGK